MFKFAKVMSMVERYVTSVEVVLAMLCRYIGDEELTDDERKELLEGATYISEKELPILRNKLNSLFR